MASIISAGTTSGTALNMSGDTSGILQLATNGTTTAITVNASQNVGIGTASPSSKLHVAGGSGSTIRNTASAGSSWFVGSNVDSYILHNESNTPMVFTTNSTERMRILSTGTFLFSGASGASTAEATGTITTYANGSAPYVSHNIDGQGAGFTFNLFKRLGTTVGNIVYNGSGVTFTTTSDYRLKENVRPATNVLDKVAKLKPCLFNWKESGAEELGFIAHELQEDFPHAVAGQKDAVEIYTDEDGNEQTRIRPQGIDTSYLVATLTAAIQELKALNDTQSATITALTARIVALETA